MSTSPIPGLSPELLSQLFAQFVAEKLGTPPSPKPKFRDLWAEFARFASAKTEGGRTRLRSWASYRTIQSHLLPYFGDMEYDQINLGACDAYRAHRRSQVAKKTGQPYKAATVNKELRTLQGSLTWALKRGLIPNHPIKGLEDELTVHDRDFAITMEQFIAILREARGQLRPLLVLYYETGCRRDELRTLEWTEVDLDKGFITILAHKAKSGKERDVPLTTNARLVLDTMARDAVNPFVFATPYKKSGPISAVALNNWLRKATKAAGVTGPKGQRVWLHTLRHTFATDSATNGMDIDTLMSIGGWADDRTLRRYVNIGRRHKEAAKARMDQRSSLVQAMLKADRAPAKASSITTAAAAEPVAAKRAAE